MSVFVKDVLSFLFSPAKPVQTRNERHHELRMRMLAMGATLASVRDGKYQSLPHASLISRLRGN